MWVGKIQNTLQTVTRLYCANHNKFTPRTLNQKVSEYFTCMDQNFAKDKPIVVITKVSCQRRSTMDTVEVDFVSQFDGLIPRLGELLFFFFPADPETHSINLKLDISPRDATLFSFVHSFHC